MTYSHSLPSAMACFVLSTSSFIAYRLCTAMLLTFCSCGMRRSSPGSYLEHTAQQHGKYSISSSMRVPSSVMYLPCFAYSMYDAESNVSHPSATASGIVSGWPAPNRWSGMPCGMLRFAVAIISASSLYSYDSMNSTGLPSASISKPIFTRLLVDFVTKSWCSPP